MFLVFCELFVARVGSKVVSAGYGSGSSTVGEGTLQDVSFTTTTVGSCPSREYRNRVLCVKSVTKDMVRTYRHYNKRVFYSLNITDATYKHNLMYLDAAT